jgi:hypothetical protein
VPKSVDRAGRRRDRKFKPPVFGQIQAAGDIVKLIKDKKTGLAALRDIRTALGAETFNLITDGMADPQIKSVAANLDKHHPGLKTSDAAWRRRHVLALAEGSVEPTEKPKSAPKVEKAKKPPAVPKTPERVSFVSAGATRKR